MAGAVACSWSRKRPTGAAGAGAGNAGGALRAGGPTGGKTGDQEHLQRLRSTGALPTDLPLTARHPSLNSRQCPGLDSGLGLRPPGQPIDHVARTPIRREHRVEDVLDRAVVEHKGETLQERHPAGLEGGQTHRRRQLKTLVRQDGERQVQALRRLALVVGVLGGQAEQVVDAEGPSLAKWSRKEQVWGVQPRAPGIMSHPSGFSAPGLPVRGYA
jgi:hypothetical protein